MNETRKTRLFAIAFILLVVLNIATLSAFFLFRKEPGPKLGGNDTAEFLVRELQLDSVQKAAFYALVREHRMQVREVHTLNREAKETFFELLKEPSVSDSLLAAAAVTANLPDQQLDMYTFRHFQKLRALCNEEQKRRFDAVIHEVLRMNAGGPPPPGAGGPPPPPPAP